MRALATSVLLAGCSFHPTADVDAAIADARPDGASTCLASGAWQVCVETPSAAATLPVSINTSPGTADCVTLTGWGTGQPEACAIVATSIMVASDTLVFGSRPLVLVATDTIAVSAVLDAGSHNGAMRSVAPGANPAACAAFATAPQNLSLIGGGGAGGTLTSRGGNGGTGNASMGGQATSQAQSPPAVLQGGCPGQRAGDGDGGGIGQAGRPGNGGGAVYLVAGAQITLGDAALIDVSGSGGESGGFISGGGGGGSGGVLVLIAPAIHATAKAKLVANGGAGASGGNLNTNGTAAPDPDPTKPTMQQAVVNGPGGSGGPGFAGGTLAAAGAPSGDGGGGGGGGAGYIQASHAFDGGSPIASPTVVLQ